MTDYKFEDMIIAYTAGELLEKLETVADEIVIMPEGGLWAGVSKFISKTESFIDAFDHTEYHHDVYEPAGEEGESCLALYKASGAERSGSRLISAAGELKQYLKEEVSPKHKAVSADDNFELGGAITEKVKFMLVRRADRFELEFQ